MLGESESGKKAEPGSIQCNVMGNLKINKVSPDYGMAGSRRNDVHPRKD